MDCICTICFDPCFGTNKSACAIDICGHMFHTSCLVGWEAKSKKKECAICSRIYRRVVHLFPSSSTDEVQLPKAASNTETKALKTRVAELERQLGEVTLAVSPSPSSQAEFNAQCLKIVEQIRIQDLEDINMQLETANNALMFKMSMYEEMFGKECSEHFDRVINGQAEEDEQRHSVGNAARPAERSIGGISARVQPVPRGSF